MKLPPLEELKILQKKFWSVNYLNTFVIYVALTKGQQPAFKQFLYGENESIIIPQNSVITFIYVIFIVAFMRLMIKKCAQI